MKEPHFERGFDLQLFRGKKTHMECQPLGPVEAYFLNDSWDILGRPNGANNTSQSLDGATLSRCCFDTIRVEGAVQKRFEKVMYLLFALPVWVVAERMLTESFQVIPNQKKREMERKIIIIINILLF